MLIKLCCLLWITELFIFYFSTYKCLKTLFLFKHRPNGEWTRAGCHTELPEDDWWKKDPIYINCTCNQLSTYAVLTDVVDEHVIHFRIYIN